MDLYRHYDANDSLLYVGVSLSTVQRLSQHRRDSGWYSEIARIEIEKCKDQRDALQKEQLAIWTECPKYNKTHNMQIPEDVDLCAWVICKKAKSWACTIRSVFLLSFQLYLTNRYLFYGWMIKMCDKQGRPQPYEMQKEFFIEMMKVQSKAHGGEKSVEELCKLSQWEYDLMQEAIENAKTFNRKAA